jgi:predicted dienelactone hydrolase
MKSPRRLALVALLLPAFAHAAEPTPQPFTLPPGTLAFTTSDVTLHDTARNKDLELRVRIPTGTAPDKGWPLLVFSHGAGGSRNAFTDLLDFLATHGYASIAPTHSDSIELKRRTDPQAVKEIFTPEGRRKLVASVSLPERITDCKTILDQLDAIADLVKSAGGNPLTIDRDRLAIGGHSAGAFTAQLLAGARPRIGLKGMPRDSIPDPRFKAAILISGQGTTSPLLSDDSWSRINIPLLVITGSLDQGPAGTGSRETPESRQEPYSRSRGTAQGGPPAYLLFIDGATHGSYQGKSGSSILRESPTTDPALIAQSTNTAVTLYLNAHLNHDPKSLELLTNGTIEKTISGKVRFEHK